MTNNGRARTLSASQAFEKNLRRASYFLDLHEATTSGRGAPTLPRRELPRGAVVFAVGAFDAFVSEISAEAMIARFEQNIIAGDTRDILSKIQRELPSLALEISLIVDREQRLDHMRAAIVEYFHTQVSNHGSRAVSRAVERMGEKPSVLWDRMKARGHPNAAAKLDEWTRKRHDIIHRGITVTVRRNEARQCIELVENIASILDYLSIPVPSDDKAPAPELAE
jgi:hypothetical protein